MLIVLKRLIEDTTFLTKFIKIKAVSMERSYDSYRIDLPNQHQLPEIIAAGYDCDSDHFFLKMGVFIDNLHRIENEPK